MRTAAVINGMIKFSEGNINSINHFMKVYGFARLIGELEMLEPEEQEVLEIAAVVHDIACDHCCRKYGHCNGKVQEEEGPAMVREFLADYHYSTKFVDKISWIVGHHHTYENVEGIEHQILLEADFLVNAGEKDVSAESVRQMYEEVFRTHSGKDLLKEMYSFAWE